MHFEETMPICDRLGKLFPGYRVKEPGSRAFSATLVHESDPDAEIHVDWQNGKKFVFSPMWPRHPKQRMECFRPEGVDLSVGVSMDRDDAGIRKDVTRRLIEPLLAALPEQKARRDAAVNREEATRQRHREWYELVAGKPMPDHVDPNQSEHTIYKHGIDKIRVNKETVEIWTKSLPDDKARKLIEFMKTL